MTFIVKHRPSPGAPMIADYECPEHGGLTLQVRRDEHGDPPAEVPCPLDIEAPWPDCRGERSVEVCGLTAEWRISAPAPKRASAAVTAVRGKDHDIRPSTVSTQLLGDGASYGEWRRSQDAARQERRHHQLIERGLKTRRVQVG